MKGIRKITKKAAKYTKIHKLNKKPNKPHCASCGKVLIGVPHTFSRMLKTTSKTKKRPQRIFGGMLCSECSRNALKEKIMNK
ncbi:50S ribosomal protein L34e [Candidatus Woesearchaeota archaeon]|nr:50S ribosomal protein L34e [Candidatus Woesearchaeota archaeon]